MHTAIYLSICLHGNCSTDVFGVLFSENVNDVTVDKILKLLECIAARDVGANIPKMKSTICIGKIRENYDKVQNMVYKLHRTGRGATVAAESIRQDCQIFLSIVLLHILQLTSVAFCESCSTYQVEGHASLWSMETWQTLQHCSDKL